MANRRIIVLERILDDSLTVAFRTAFWVPVPTARKTTYATTLFTSKVVAPNAPTTAEQTDLNTGVVVEIIETVTVPKTTPGVMPTDAAIQTSLIAMFNALQAQVNARNDWWKYGSSWDGTTWTMKVMS